MNDALATANGNKLLQLIAPMGDSVLIALNDERFADAESHIGILRDAISTATSEDDDAFLNDLYVLQRYADLLTAYVQMWQALLSGDFSGSWNNLQDARDSVWVIEQFSSIPIEGFERQLCQLEKVYPYEVFASVGAIVEKVECNLCTEDIDSESCSHRRGQLYGGKMAHGIVRSAELEHVALTTEPLDKRCVVILENDSPQFRIVKILAEGIATKRCRLLDIGELRFSKVQRPNPDYVKVGRNDPCFCNSGRKFKKCCLPKRRIESDHVDIIAVPWRIHGGVLMYDADRSSSSPDMSTQEAVVPNRSLNWTRDKDARQ